MRIFSVWMRQMVLALICHEILSSFLALQQQNFTLNNFLYGQFFIFKLVKFFSGIKLSAQLAIYFWRYPKQRRVCSKYEHLVKFLQKLLWLRNQSLSWAVMFYMYICGDTEIFRCLTNTKLGRNMVKTVQNFWLLFTLYR